MSQNAVNIAFEDYAQIIERYGADGLVVLESVNETAADVVFFNQGVGRHFPLSEGFINGAYEIIFSPPLK